MCEEKAAKWIKRFFGQRHVKSEFQPRDNTSDQARYRIWVCSRPPRTMAAGPCVEICQTGEEGYTLCGSTIRVNDRIAKIGGIVRVVTLEKGDMLYAMTAGHIFGEEEADQRIHDGNSSEEEDEHNTNDDESFDDEEFELDSGLGEEEKSPITQKATSPRILTPTEYAATNSNLTWSPLGHKAMRSHSLTGKKNNLDWALIQMNDPSECLPNVYGSSSTDHGYPTWNEMKEVSRRSMKIEASRSVTIISDLFGGKAGKISTMTSFLKTGLDSKFTETYCVELCGNSGNIRLLQYYVLLSKLTIIQHLRLVIVALGLLMKRPGRCMAMSLHQTCLARLMSSQ